MMENRTVIYNEPYIGWWGAPNSIIDFCEPNYAVSHYFAEFFNTLSSLPIIMWGILGLTLTHYYATKQFRFKLCFMSLMFVGVGSFLFHASLRYKYQLLDELPMLLTSASTLFCTLTLHLNKMNRAQYLLILSQTSITMLEILLYVYFKIWSIFFIGYAVNVAIITYYLVKYHLKNSLIKKWFMFSWLCYYGGFFIWCIDMKYCEYVQVFQFHSFWHCAAGYGSYLISLVLVLIKATYLKKKTSVTLLNASDLLWTKDESKQHSIIDIPLVHYCQYQMTEHED